MINYGSLNVLIQVLHKMGFVVFREAYYDPVLMNHHVRFEVLGIKLIQVVHLDEQVAVNKAIEEIEELLEELKAWKRYPELNDPH